MTNDSVKPKPPLVWLWWLPALLWAAFIFWLSNHTSDELPQIEIPYLDKVVHFILFGTQSVLLFAAIRFGAGRRFWLAAALAFVLTSLYGGSDEIHQLWTPGRSSDIRDWIVDTLGAAMIFLSAFARPKGPPPP